jgi:hypothetical protein
MIFGKTHQQHHEEFLRLLEWRKFFALFPIQMENGQWVWLEALEQRLVDNYYGYRTEYRRVT